MTLNNLGLLDEARNRWDDARKETVEALKIYRELARKEPESYLPYVAARSTIWVFWITPRTDRRMRARHSKRS
jgi:hypothetical protein